MGTRRQICSRYWLWLVKIAAAQTGMEPTIWMKQKVQTATLVLILSLCQLTWTTTNTAFNSATVCLLYWHQSIQFGRMIYGQHLRLISKKASNFTKTERQYESFCTLSWICCALHLELRLRAFNLKIHTFILSVVLLHEQIPQVGWKLKWLKTIGLEGVWDTAICAAKQTNITVATWVEDFCYYLSKWIKWRFLRTSISRAVLACCWFLTAILQGT